MLSPEYSAPAKIILFGEHAVVYGQPAIAVPVSSLRATATYEATDAGLKIHAVDLNKVLPVEVDSDVVDDALIATARKVLAQLHATPPDVLIRLQSTIPMASGLGSGAAISTVLARTLIAALGQQIAQGVLNTMIYEIEKIHHGTPSGIDNTVIVYEKPVYFIRDHLMETLTIAAPFTLIIGDTGQGALTKVAVGDVRRLVEAESGKMQPILAEIGAISQQARKAIEMGDIDALGPLMTRNHTLLQQLTVSSPELDVLVDAALAAGALGAKLSGGGRGGNMIALVSPTQGAERIKQALLDAGASQVFTTTVG